MALSKAQTKRVVRTGNVVEFRLSILPRHLTLLAKWLRAGRCMGLCDASLCQPGPEGEKAPYILVWVRENADPAYMISVQGMRWAVTDHLRQNTLVRVSTFEEALHFIRPVLPLNAAAA